MNIASAKTQTNNYLANNKIDSNGLYVVWAGANDLLAASADPTNAQAIILGAVGSQVNTIKTLKDNGANYILVPNIPDVGLTPRFIRPLPTRSRFDRCFAAQKRQLVHLSI